ncbi:class I SAM-dependent methyltransferase [Streptomyces sp. P38-E01]|uniref:Class I SAM-dependent methyltransferase n=1 Tax=Streptomyces tardus TaxID=2780544 RepID=A0A949JAI2_9ACTN|nr:class I SAM-dependent methyltransferase [Streptomyces tardus]MBU7596477.1 class I SAM-dependent methyltransferase [Streptomyces tardus]
MPAPSAPPPDPADLPPEARPRLLSLSAAPAPRRVVEVDDLLRADAAFKLVCEGTALLWRGDFHGARQLLTALGRRADRSPAGTGESARETFHLHRRSQGRRARLLGMLLVPLESDHSVPLRRAPDVREACAHAYGPLPQVGGDGEPAGYAVALRELLGAVGGWEWRRKGVEVPALGGDRIHPYHGVFSPMRGEYVDLVARAPLPADRSLALDLGTGTGVLAVVLARRGVRRVVATELDPRARECARENVERLGAADRVEVREADLYPDGRAPLVVCNPPWVPAKPTSPIEHAVYDPGSRMLRGFLSGLRGALLPDGEGWLILSDLAEHLELRSREELLGLFEQSGLEVLDRLDARPRHPKARDEGDPLAAARGAEVTSLWRLAAAPA